MENAEVEMKNRLTQPVICPAPLLCWWTLSIRDLNCIIPVCMLLLIGRPLKLDLWFAKQIPSSVSTQFSNSLSKTLTNQSLIYLHVLLFKHLFIILQTCRNWLLMIFSGTYLCNKVKPADLDIPDTMYIILQSSGTIVSLLSPQW